MSTQLINLPSSTRTLHINRGVLVGKPIKKIIPSWARWCTLLMAILKTQKQEDLCELKAKLVYMISAKPDKIAK